jgi:hypothetical protein
MEQNEDVIVLIIYDHQQKENKIIITKLYYLFAIKTPVKYKTENVIQ